MKAFYCLSLLLLAELPNALALPVIDPDTPIRLDEFSFRGNEEHKSEGNPHGLSPELIASMMGEVEVPSTLTKRASFDAKKQLVDITGKHRFIEPDFANGEIRGLCPGLNALANHDYLPRNGVASFAQYVTGVGKVWGMSADLASLLTLLGVTLGGNLRSVSQGGWSKFMDSDADTLGGLLGKPKGLIGVHNLFEVDGSPTRNDLYDPIGNNNDMNMSYFMDLYNLQKDAEDPNYSIEVLFEHNARRREQAIAFNPYFFAGPASGWMVRASPYCFTARLVANRSEEYPDEGRLDKAGLKNFFAVYGPEENMEYRLGMERLSENFYRRANTDYGIAALAIDIVVHSLPHPEIMSIGGNTGGVNTFTGIDLGDLTGGVINAKHLLDPNNLICFVLNILRMGLPNASSSLFATLNPIVDAVVSVLNPILKPISCPVWTNDIAVNGTNWLESFTKQFPGAQKRGFVW